MCARDGSRYVLVGSAGNYELAGDLEQFSALAGQRVNLVGVLHGSTIKVSSASLQAGTGPTEAPPIHNESDPAISAP